MDWNSGDVRLLVFLREDIMNYVQSTAREPDKVLLVTHRISWEDPGLLARVIEERFMACDSSLSHQRVWDKYFCESIDGVPTKEYILRRILPRPRDLIWVVQRSIYECVNHSHQMIEESDIRAALRDYFNFLVENTVTEYALECPKLRDVILSFFGCEEVPTWHSVSRRLEQFAVDAPTPCDLIRLLIRASFLGVELNHKEHFAYSEAEAAILARQALSIEPGSRTRPRLSIHPAFRLGLQLKQCSSTSSTRTLIWNLIDALRNPRQVH